MATAHPIPTDHLDINLPPAIEDLPGSTVDALLQAGDPEAAKAEFNRLIQEGIDSGDAQAATPEFWSNLRSQLQREAGNQA